MIKSNYLYIAKQYGLLISLVVCGLGLMITGLVISNRQTKGEEVIIVAPSVSPEPSASIEPKHVVVDVAGEVIKPGVYRLPAGSRVAEALVAAGGLTNKASGDFVSKRLNQADLIKDGSKLFIPNIEEEEVEMVATEMGSFEQTAGLISINTSSESLLDELWGVGQARAKQIIDNRPYTRLEELVSKAGLPQSIIDNNQGKIGL